MGDVPWATRFLSLIFDITHLISSTFEVSVVLDAYVLRQGCEPETPVGDRVFDLALLHLIRLVFEARLENKGALGLQCRVFLLDSTHVSTLMLDYLTPYDLLRCCLQGVLAAVRNVRHYHFLLVQHPSVRILKFLIPLHYPSFPWLQALHWWLVALICNFLFSC